MLWSGQHNIARQFRAYDQPTEDASRFDPSLGGLSDLFGEFEQSDATRLLLSSEDFDVVTGAGLKRLARHFDGWDVAVLVYFRPQANWLQSYYHTMVNNGLGLSFESWIDSFLEEQGARLDYHQLPVEWRKAFSEGSVVVGPYHAVASGKLIEDFVSRAGIAVEVDRFDVPAVANQAQGAKVLEAQRIYAAGPGAEMTPRQVRPRLAAIRQYGESAGWPERKAWMVDDRLVARLVEMYGESNRRLSQEFLDPDNPFPVVVGDQEIHRYRESDFGPGELETVVKSVDGLGASSGGSG